MPNWIMRNKVDHELQTAARDSAARAGVSFAALVRTAVERLLNEGLSDRELGDICSKWDDEAYRQRNIERRARELLARGDVDF
jgi:hypothetical protein